MLPLGDLTRPRRPPFVTLGLVATNVLVWLVYQVPHGIDHSVSTLGFRPCGVNGSCSDSGLPWPAEVLFSMFGHGSWSHLVGNMVFLLAFGPLVEELLGPVRYLGTYLLCGLAAHALQGGLTLAFVPHDGNVPNIGASGAISGVLAAFIVARPFERIVSWLLPVLFLRIPALGLIGVWFLLQAIEGSYSLANPAGVVGIAFFAHVGGFIAGLALASFFLPDSWPRKLRPPPPRGLAMTP